MAGFVDMKMREKRRIVFFPREVYELLFFSASISPMKFAEIRYAYVTRVILSVHKQMHREIGKPD